MLLTIISMILYLSMYSISTSNSPLQKAVFEPQFYSLRQIEFLLISPFCSSYFSKLINSNVNKRKLQLSSFLAWSSNDALALFFLFNSVSFTDYYECWEAIWGFLCAFSINISLLLFIIFLLYCFLPLFPTQLLHSVSIHLHWTLS